MAEKSVAAPKMGRLWSLLISGLIVLVIGDIALRSISYFGAYQPHSHEANETAKAGQGNAKTRKPEVKATLPLDSFLVNLADKEEFRFVKAQFQLGMAEDSEELVKDPVILAATRDTIISLLSAKTSYQIMTPQGKDQLRDEIRNRVNAILPKGKVNEVFIVDFVVQL